MRRSTRGQLIGLAGVAELLGVSVNTVGAYRARGRLPKPDDLSVPDRPRWREATITAWHAGRPGQGNHTRGKQRRGGVAPSKHA